jgi:hypothetical protein
VSATVTDSHGIIAIAAAAAAALALIWSLLLTVRLRRLRGAQRVVLGEREARDLVSHSAELDAGFTALRDYVADVAERIDARLLTVEHTLRGVIAHRALVRYDAYNEMSGHQSMSIALLDETQSGIVLSSIHHRDQARLYAKQVYGGRSELELSPEEAEAVRLALTAPPTDAGSPAAERG